MASSILERFISKVTIEGFPSRTEIYELVNKFFDQNSFEKDYTVDNKDLVIIFCFKSSVR